MKERKNLPVTEKEYLSAMKLKEMDTSDFLLLTLSLLDGKLTNPEIKKNISTCYVSYLNNDYNQAIERMMRIIEVSKAALNPQIIKAIEAKKLKLIDNPDRNDSRRYFETRFAQAYVDLASKKDNFKSAIPLLPAIKSEMSVLPAHMKAIINKKLPTAINGYDDAKRLLELCYLFNDTIAGFALKQTSAAYTKKDRSDKDSGIVITKRGGRIEPLTSNPGTMKSTTANFLDQLIDEPVPAKAVDIYKIDTTAKAGFSATHTQIPMAGGASGSIFGLLVLLQKMMEQNKASPTLETDVNRVIKIFLTEYIKEGYHSMHEVLEILKEPNVKKIFEEYNVKLDLAFPLQVIENSRKEAEQYAKSTTLKKVMQEELISHPPKLKHVETRLAKTSLFNHTSENKPPVLTNQQLAQRLHEYIKNNFPEFASKIKSINLEGDKLIINTVVPTTKSDVDAKREDKKMVREGLFIDKLNLKAENVPGVWLFKIDIEDVRKNNKVMTAIQSAPSITVVPSPVSRGPGSR